MDNKIFNKCKKIDFETIIHTTSLGGNYKFLGVRDKRLKHEAILYTIPNNIYTNKPNIKGIQKQELEEAWLRLLNNGELTKKWFSENLVECNKEGGCNFKAICGIIETMFPERFKILHGKIVKI